MQQIIFLIHILAAIGLVVLVLLQHGKGADMGAAFGSGASSTIFGSAGSLPFLVKVTAIFATIFFISCLALGFTIAKHVKPQPQSLIIPTAPTVPIQPMTKPLQQSQTQIPASTASSAAMNSEAITTSEEKKSATTNASTNKSVTQKHHKKNLQKNMN